MSGAPSVARARRGEMIAFAFLAALGGAVLGTSFGYGVFVEGDRVGPGFLPMVTGLLLVVLSCGQLATRLRAAWRHGGGPTDERTTEQQTADAAGLDVLGRTQAQRNRQLWLVIATVLVTIVLVPYLGFLIGFGLMVLFITTVVEGRPWTSGLLVAVAAVGIVYGVFTLFLDVPLPAGLLQTGG